MNFRWLTTQPPSTSEDLHIRAHGFLTWGNDPVALLDLWADHEDVFLFSDAEVFNAAWRFSADGTKGSLFFLEESPAATLSIHWAEGMDTVKRTNVLRLVFANSTLEESQNGNS